MTIVFSAACSDFIVMANDSAVLLEFADHREYTTGRKWYASTGRGCVTMWGARDANVLVQYLSTAAADNLHTTMQLIRSVNSYLTTSFDPHAVGLADTGFHIGGFDAGGRPLLFHAFYNAPGSPAAFESRGAYSLQDQSPAPGVTRFLFNGRHDLAFAPIGLLIGELNAGRPVRFPRTPDGVGRLAHLVLRFAAELSPDVGPPFFVHLISSKNSIKSLSLETLSPLPAGYFEQAWAEVTA